MSTATVVPETWALEGESAWVTLRHTGRRRLLAEGFQRMRYADGFSHARSLAFMTSLVLVQGVIAIVGFAGAVGNTSLSRSIRRAIEAAVPGPAGEELTLALTDARATGLAGRYVALSFGLVAALFTATTAFGQLERGLNRIYGVEQDRPSVRKYTRAFVVAVTAGGLTTIAFVSVAFGRNVGTTIGNATVNDIWGVVRWPFALVLMAGAVTLLFRLCPRRRQPSVSWLTFGAGVSIGLWFVFTVLLAVFFEVSSSFGETYGPLTGVVALLLWSLLSSIALLFGAAVGAQLEAVRAGRLPPQDEEKVQHSEPMAVLGGARLVVSP